MISSRKLEDLHPDLIPKAKDFKRICLSLGIDVIITCTYRDEECQTELYKQGRTKPGKIVTRAQAGESAHNSLGADGKPAAMAFDFVPLRNGKLVWGTAGDGLDDDPSDDHTDDLELWQRCGQVATELGLLWAGYWTKMREYPHCQLPGFVPRPTVVH